MTPLTVATIVLWCLSLWAVLSLGRSRGLLRKLRRLIIGVAGAAVASVLSLLLVFTHAFEAFSRETLVAEVRVQRLGPDAFELTYQPAGAEETTQTFPLRGDQWAVSGGIVKWHPWLTALGLQGYHKPMRVAGRFADPAREQAAPPSVAVLHEGADRLWEWLYRAAPSLPFIEAVYGSGAYVYAEPNVVAELYVTPSGYLIKRSLVPESRQLAP